MLVGFTMDNVEERFNKQLIRLSEIGAAGGMVNLLFPSHS